jgi:prepilin-type N-terminal cleavage/methylation domain-containing protein
MQIKKSKGFTIIELIVVIAIIAILASIVLVNVTVYINKAKDAKVNSDVASIALGMGSCYAAANGAAYVGCDTNLTYVPQALKDDIASANNKSAANSWFSNPQVATYVFCGRMPSVDTQATCVDSTGVTVTSLWTSCTGTPTACTACLAKGATCTQPGTCANCCAATPTGTICN